MKPVRYLVVADPPERIQPKYDTSLRLSAELLRRGIRVDYCDISQLDATLEPQAYLASLPVTELRAVDPKKTPFWERGPVRQASVEDYDVILQRKDPPVDSDFIAHAKIFATAPKRILQINNPDENWRYSEHALPADYPEISVPTRVCRSEDELIAAVRAHAGESVAKPYDECSGNGIRFFAQETPEVDLREYFTANPPAVILQPFVHEITKSGDLRILTMNGKIMGSVLRVPRAGSRLANLHQGATARLYVPSKEQNEAALTVAADLLKKGLYLLGIDFIGEKISEINITSPSAMAQINEVMNQRTEVELVNELESLRYRKLTGSLE